MCTLSLKQEKDLGKMKWERKILRNIFVEWMIRTNEEIKALNKSPDIISVLKQGRLRWLGHIERMDENRTAKKT